MSKKTKRHFGDRKDARWVKDTPGLQTIMANILINRTDCEVYLNDKIDATNLVHFLEEKNASHPDYKTTIFHAVLTALARMVKERPKLNYFIQGRRMYERNTISLSFVAKRRFADNADEALMMMEPGDEDTLDTISKKIVGDVTETRKSEHSTDGIDSIIDKIAKLPRPILIPFMKLVRICDFWGKNPSFFVEGNPNYATILATNLGSIQCPAVYHHLNNYGTNSIMIAVGTLHKEEMVMPDGHKEIRDVIDIGATLDERIADGFYFARSLKLVKYIFENPELLDQPLGENSGYQYE